MSDNCMLCLSPVSEDTAVRLCHSRPQGLDCCGTVMCCDCVGSIYERGGLSAPNVCMVCSEGYKGPRFMDMNKVSSEKEAVDLLESAGFKGTEAALKQTARRSVSGIYKCYNAVKHELHTNKNLLRKWIKLLRINHNTMSDCGKRRSVRHSTIVKRYKRAQKHSMMLANTIYDVNYELEKSGLAFRV